MKEQWNIIPIKRGNPDPKQNKRPLINWKEFQTVKFPPNSLKYYEPCNYGVVCGKTSNNLVILDFDFRGELKYGGIISTFYQNFPSIDKTHIVATPHGLHIYFYIEGECPTRQTQLESPFEEIEHIDILGEGGYALIPPSSTGFDLYYLEIEMDEPATITREEFDKIVAFYTITKEDEKILPEQRSIDLDKFRPPFKDILEGKLNIETVAKQTKQDEFIYWKFMFIEGQINGYRPEELYPLLRLNQPSFNLEECEKQITYHIKPNSRPMTNNKIHIYFPDYENIEEFEDWVKIANRLLEEFDIITMEDSKQVLVKKGNIYSLDNKDFFKKMASLLLKISKGKSYNNKRASILQYFEDTTKFSRDDFYFDRWVINFKNGYYDLKREKFIPHEENDKIFCYEIPHDYKLYRHECPQYKQLLKDWLGDKNPIKPDDIFEMIGYTMTMNVKMKKAFFIFGEHDSGKTTFQNILEYLIGEKNRSATSLQRMCSNEFGTSSLQFKILNMVGDMSSSTIEDMSMFKVITGGDKHVEAEIKGGNQFQFRNMVKIWYNANKIPKIKDMDDEAIFVRWILINFPNYFGLQSDDTIQDLDEQICDNEEEIQGIIHEAIKGAKRLLKRGHFRTEIVENTEFIWKYNSDYLYAFLHDYCVKGEDEGIIATEFHTEFNNWLYKNKRKPLSPRSIKPMLEEHGIFKLRDTTGDRLEYYNGIGWKPEPVLKYKKF